LLDSLLQENLQYTMEETPVTDQPVPIQEEETTTSPPTPPESSDGGSVTKSSSWWGVTNLSSLLTNPHLLEESFNSVASQVAQATSGASKMVKSKSMEVMKAVTEDLGEVKETLGQYTGPMTNYTAPIKGAGSLLKEKIKELDEVTDDMAEVAINNVSSGATSLWRVASGYASQMFDEDDLPATAMIVGNNSEPIILDRLQAQLHALASDSGTYTQDPDPSDCSAEEWTSYLANGLDLDKRQGEISELMINNTNIRKHYSSLVPAQVQHKLFWGRYFYKVHLIEKQEVKRQVLKKRAEQTKADSDSEINWDEEEDLDIPDEVQEKLLTDYEAELKTGKTPSHAKKDSDVSDDWEKLSNASK